MARYVKITITAGHGIAPQQGLSELRFLYIPTFAREPEPLDGSTTASATVALAWRAGRDAASHQVLLGTTADALALVDTTPEASTKLTALNFATTYFWQVKEVNDAEDPASHTGPVWSFITPAYSIVDSFDQYDDDCNRIFFVWLDGLGHNGGEDIDDCDVAPYNGNGTGSIVGNATSPFAEKTIVHSGTQSMPLAYDSDVSETTIALDAQDWTVSGIKSLSLYFYGAPGNTGQLYVRINNTKLTYDGDPTNIGVSSWQAWNIDLATVGGDLQNVRELAVGVEGGTSGILHIDAIRLYPRIGTTVTPVMPDTANLLAYYPLDGDYQDASGNGRHGVAVDDMGSLFIDGVSGQALDLSSGNGYVEIPGFKGVTAIDGVQQPFSISNWFKITETSGNNEMVTWGLQGDATRLTWSVNEGRLRTEHNSGNLRGNTYVNDGEWHFGALTVAEGANLRPDVTKLYVDGVEDSILSGTGSDNAYNLQPDADVCIGCRADNKTRFWPGSLDEVRIYDRVLSAEEVAGLAGKTKPVHKPF